MGQRELTAKIRNRFALALIVAVLGPAAVAGEGSRLPATAVPHAPAEAPTTAPLAALATAVAAWVAQAMAVPMPAELPRIAFVAPEAMETLRIGSEAATTEAPRALDVVALYDDARRAIMLPVGWTGASPAEMSVLAHEMVHHLQNVGGRSFACGAAREAEAYEVQQRWLEQFGTDLEAEFELNRLALFVLTRCGR